MVGKSKELDQNFRCRYCQKSFRKETTLSSHMCEPKRRWQQEKETGVQMGLRAYLRFFEYSQGSAKLKSYEDFVTSPYYNGFVKFGRYCQDIRCVNYINFLDWLLKNNKKLDNWTSDQLYEQWLLEYLKYEAVQDAIERALKEMQLYADTHPDLKNGFTDYFRYGNVNRICHHISTGRISPWVIFNSNSGIEFLSDLNEEQVEIILTWIDPSFWDKKFKDYKADTLWVKSILEQAGL